MGVRLVLVLKVWLKGLMELKLMFSVMFSIGKVCFVGLVRWCLVLVRCRLLM